MKVIASHVTDNKETWFRVELDRNTDITVQRLYTPAEVEELQRQAVKKFLDNLFEMAIDFNN